MKSSENREKMDNKTIEFWNKMFSRMSMLLTKIESTNPNIDDLDLRFVSARVEYWQTDDRILNKNEMLKANSLWKKYNSNINA